MGELVLVIGGVRSGKSEFAERLAAEYGSGVLYVATAEAGDEEMAARIAAHVARRPAAWRTVEAPLDPVRVIHEADADALTVLLDCVGFLVSNILLGATDPHIARDRLGRVIDQLLAEAEARQGPMVAVTSDVGSGLVPLTSLGRRYQDLLGSVNKQLAARAQHVYWIVAGLALDLRQLGVQRSDGT
jgi:adenosylcobinamide kinase / adenosylcobinamide-phosphate guanylyltransferase